MGSILSVCGAKDGVGKTAFAIHLAFGLAKASQKNVCLIEADIPNFGDLKTYLNLKQNKTLVDFIKNSTRLDPKLAQNWIGKNPNGLYVLDAVTFSTDFQNIDDLGLDKSLKLLARSFDYVIMDLGRDINPLSFRAFENSSLIFVVSSSNVLAINQTAEFSKKLRSLQFGSDIQKLVLNQYDPRGIISPQVIKQKFNMEAAVLLPDDPAAFNQSLSQAKPLQMLNPKHPYLKGIDDTIRMLSTLEEKVEKSRVTRVGVSQPLDVLKQVLPFSFGGGAGGNQKILAAGSTSKALMDRNIAIRT
ncbi:MAG: AAA family ATPase, partial [Deltaproteobacteria bacterium]|nr:AAA family ATPase [Deltaproteobacteria bacterium]